QGGDQLAASLAGANDLIDEAARGRYIRICELFSELVYFFGTGGNRIGGGVQLTLVQDVDGSFRPHHGDLGGRPRVVEVGPNVLARHHAVCAAVRFARDDGDLRHRRLGECEQQLCAVPDDAAVLLHSTWQESRHVLEGDERNVEGVAK